MSQSPEVEIPDEHALKQGYAQTRRSLIERLGNWEDQRTWEEFYQTYWRLIYAISKKAGLAHDEAFDVVQETILTVAKQWQKGQTYDPAKGSFKTWLMNMTRWRIADQYRKKQRNPAALGQSCGTPGGDGTPRDTATVERIVGENGESVLDQIWENEWRSNLAEVALERVKKLVSPQQFQLFDAYVVKGWDTDRVKNELGVSAAQVYLAKHRVGALLKKQVEELKREFEG